jgi:5-methylcytosine-specific restriction endonuclease McrBC regulatory subunit McrC
VKFETLVGYSDEKFRRITGVKRVTFEKMLEILCCTFTRKHAQGGRKPKLPIEEQLLATLEYIREYRTYAHIAASYQIDESNMYRMIRWVEDTLVKDGTFHYPVIKRY